MRDRVLIVALLCPLVAGCELVADFDRDKIVEERPAVGGPDGATSTPDEDDAGSVVEDAGADDAGGDEDAG
jgi:hypothetical protein